MSLKLPDPTLEDQIVFEVGGEDVIIPIQVSGTDRAGNPRWIIPESWKKGKKLGTWLNRDFPIEVQDNPIVNELRGSRKNALFDFSIASTNDPKQRFKDVVLAFNDIYNNTGVMANKEQIDMKSIKGLGSDKQQQKFLLFAKAIGLYKERGDKPKVRKKPSHVEKELEQFQQQEKVADWLKRSRYEEDKGNTMSSNLQKALFVMDTSPDQILLGDETSNMDKTQHYEDWLFAEMKKPRWTDSTGKKWSLEEWALQYKRPFVSGKGNEYSTEGQKIAYAQRANARKGSLSQWENFKTALKHYTHTHGKITGGKYGASTPLSLPSPTLHYSTLKMTAEEILKCEACLSDLTPQLEFEEESLSLEYSGEIVEGKYVEHEFEGQKKKIPFTTTIEDWRDAELYFAIGLDVGWRATEGLTATYGTATYWKDTNQDLKYTSGVWIDKSMKQIPEGIMYIRFLTRKTWGKRDKKGKERTTHTEMILTPKTRILVQNKIDKIQEGINQYGKMSDEEIFEKYGVQHWKWVDGKKELNESHALIGYDGKYIDVETMKFPTQHKLSKKQKREEESAGKTLRQVKATKNQLTLHAIMRQCFKASGVDLDKIDKDGHHIGGYWLSDTLHSIRHIFAQKWLLQSNWNFSFVTKKGHWGASQILEDAYGGTSDTQYLQTSLEVANRTLEIAEKEEELELSKSVETHIQEDTSDKSDTGGTGGNLT